MKEDKERGKSFFIELKERGLTGVRLFIADKCFGMPESPGEVCPDAKYQRCTVHFYRNVFFATPRKRMREVSLMLKAILSQENREAAPQKSKAAAQCLNEMKRSRASRIAEDKTEETLPYMSSPSRHRLQIRTNNTIERINREMKRGIWAIGAFPDGQSARMLVCARLRRVAGSDWGTKRYLNMHH